MLFRNFHKNLPWFEKKLDIHVIYSGNELPDTGRCLLNFHKKNAPEKIGNNYMYFTNPAHPNSHCKDSGQLKRTLGMVSGPRPTMRSENHDLAQPALTFSALSHT